MSVGGIHLVTGDDGEPLGVVDVDLVVARGQRLALAAAAVCDDPAALEALGLELRAEVGAAEAHHTAAAALDSLLRLVVAPLMRAVEKAGLPLRQRLVEEASADRPPCPGCGQTTHGLSLLLGWQVCVEGLLAERDGGRS